MKIICIGRNYRAHAAELNNPVPEKPVFFMKPDSALLTGNKPFFIPGFSSNVHYEMELVVKIDRLGKCIDRKFAKRYYNEVTGGIDFTARDLQDICKNEGNPWEIAKAFDGSAALGKFIPLSKLTNSSSISFSLQINDKTVQSGNTDDMLFGIDELIAYVSQFMTLKTGDLLFTGTPAGVGPVVLNDCLTGFVEDKKVFEFRIK